MCKSLIGRRLNRILVGFTIFLSLTLLTMNSYAEEKTYNWKDKPVIVNIQVNLESNGDQAYIDKILREIEKYIKAGQRSLLLANLPLSILKL